MGQSSDVCASKTSKAPIVPESLRIAFSDMGARRRIYEVNQRDKRTLSAIDQRFRELDRLVDYLLKHLDDPVPLNVPASPRRRRTPTDLDLALGTTPPPEAEPTEVDLPPVPAPVAAASPTMPDLPAVLPPAPPMASERVWRAPRSSQPVPQVESLLRDVMWLLEIKDGEGMLISLERLLVSATVEGELATFVADNEVKLLNVYESYLGPFSKIMRGASPEGDMVMPAAFMENTKIACLMELTRTGITMDSLLKVSPYSKLETCCIVSQLRRVELLTFGSSDSAAE